MSETETKRHGKRVYRKRWPRKNLGELLNFLEGLHPQGLSLNELSGELGLTVGALSNLFMRDDLKLSRAEYIVSAYGYRLRLFFPVKTYPEGITPPVYTRKFDKAGNITGLAKYIYDSNWTINSVSKEIGIWPSILTNAFNKGDILLSNLYRITDALGIYFIWEYDKIQSGQEDV